MGALQVNYRIYVDVRNENTGTIIAKQNDTKTRYLDITITDNGVPIDLTGCEVRIYGRKYDNTEIYNDGIIQDAATGRCLFEATTQLLAYPGQNVRCEIVVFKDNVQILSTMPFDIFVVKSLMGENAIESSNEYGTLVVLFQNLYEAHDLMTTMVQNIGTPDAVAAQYDLATMWQAWEFLVAYMKGDLTNKIDEAIANAAVQGVLDRIGITTDTGGSETAGTVMGKENAILNAITRGAAQTKKFTETVFINHAVAKEDAETDFVTVEGKGRAFIINRSSKPPQTTVDGNLVIDAVSNMGVDSYEVYFEESLILKNADTSSTTYTIRAIIQT